MGRVWDQQGSDCGQVHGQNSGTKITSYYLFQLWKERTG